MAEETILLDIADGVGRITFNRPSKFNSFNRPMSLALQAALDECDSNAAVRSIYISATGKAFCAGQDLQEAIDPEGPEVKRIVEEHYNPIILRLRNIEKPIVVAVNGVAAGAGANLALAGDVVVAKESALFVQAFISIGLIPDCGGTFMLPRLVGWGKASGLMMTADKIDGKEATQLGMIYKAISDDHFEKESWEIAVKLASMPTRGLGMTKRLLNASYTNSLSEQLKEEAKVQTMASQTEDFQEGVQAFLEKRKPNFKGN